MHARPHHINISGRRITPTWRKLLIACAAIFASAGTHAPDSSASAIENRQDGGKLDAPSTAPAGGFVEVTVKSNDTFIEVVIAGSNNPTRLKVPPSKKVRVPVPNQPGNVLLVHAGQGFDACTILIAIVAP